MSILFSPITINGTTLKNRIVMAPMCMLKSDDEGFVKDFHLVHYGARAIGNVGLIILEATSISKEGRITDLDLGIWSDEHIAGLKILCEVIQGQGAKAGIQIAHAGRKSMAKGIPLSCSNVIEDSRYSAPKEMTLSDIDMVKDEFLNGVRRAASAGFDVIEIHGAHGYLINQFLSPITNKRTDQYGGSVENRTRFLKEILESIRSIYKGTLCLRISATDYKEEGLKVEDYVLLFKSVQNIDIISVSSGGVVDGLDIDTFEGYQVPLASTIKNSVSIPVGAVGMINSSKFAENILKENKADLILLARELIRNPNWSIKAAYELGAEPSISPAYKRGY